MPPFHDAAMVSIPVDLWPRADGTVRRADVGIVA